MKGDSKSEKNNEVRVELKYCEHCGGLWVREGGAGAYCEKCQPKVADLPVPRQRISKAKLPVRKRGVVEDFEIEPLGNGDLEAVGGVA